jgi:hypothetical protein
LAFTECTLMARWFSGVWKVIENETDTSSPFWTQCG